MSAELARSADGDILAQPRGEIRDWRARRARPRITLSLDPGYAYRLTELGGWHWSNLSGGVQHRANRHYLHAYAWCDGMIAGELAHRCEHGPPPHRIKVCITKKGNEKFWRAIAEAAPPRLDPIHGRRR